MCECTWGTPALTTCPAEPHRGASVEAADPRDLPEPFKGSSLWGLCAAFPSQGAALQPSSFLRSVSQGLEGGFMCISSSSSVCSFRSCQAAPVSPRRIQECTLGKHLKQGGTACSLQHSLHYSQKLYGTFCTPHAPKPRSWAEPSPHSPGTKHSRAHEEMQNSLLQQGSPFKKGNEARRILEMLGSCRDTLSKEWRSPRTQQEHRAAAGL